MDVPEQPAGQDTAGISLLARLRARPWFFLTALMLVAGLLVLGLQFWRGSLVVVESVVRRDFVQSVVASGRVETPHRVEIGAQITASVQQVPVAEGQQVAAGQVLVVLDGAELEAARRQAESAVQQAEARLRQVHELQGPVAEQSLRQAQATLDNANKQYQRNQRLQQQGFIAPAALEESRKALDLADAQVNTARKQLETTRPAGSDHALAQAALAQARASADAARARARYAVVSAPLAGTLIARHVEAGDVVQPGKVLMTLSPTGKTQLVVDIDEKNLRLLALGQPALASADAYPQQPFGAVLAYINPGVNPQTGAVAVKLDVPHPPAVLRQDMTVSVDIEVARRSGALLVPLAAVRDADSASPWVLRVEAGRAERRPVRLGLRSGGQAEVLEGLAEGDAVIPTSAAVKTGARVHQTATAR